MPEEVKQTTLKKEDQPETSYAPIQHSHTGSDTPKVSTSDFRDNLNIFKTNTTYPPTTPGNFWARIHIITSAGSSRLYIYDTTTSTWKSVIIS